LDFEIKLPLFEGPFDLLLFFIERDELDIYDIPISRITKDFLEYLRELEKLNIDLASEFILVASTLMKIKAKMLLPRPEIDEAGQEIDPRDELIKHLLEYKKYKSVLQEFAGLEEKMLLIEKRGNVLSEIKHLSKVNDVEAELQDLDLYKLLKVFARLNLRFEAAQNRPVHHVVVYPYTIESQKDFIIGRLKNGVRLAFTQLIEENKDRIVVIFNFMAILELLQLRSIKIQVGLGFNNFWIEENEEYYLNPEHS